MTRRDPAQPAHGRRDAGHPGRDRRRPDRPAGRHRRIGHRPAGRCPGGSHGPCGWRVLIPQTKDPADEMVELLRLHGAIPQRVPTVAVEPPRTPAQMEPAVKGLVDGRYQWIVFTSVNSVRAVWEKFTEFGLGILRVRIACVDSATGEAVRALGIVPELISADQQSSAGLLATFPGTTTSSTRSTGCCCRGPTSPPKPSPRGLRERGWEIDDVTAYGPCGRRRRPRRSGRPSRPAASRRSASPPRPRCATWSASPASRTPGRWWPASGPDGRDGA